MPETPQSPAAGATGGSKNEVGVLEVLRLLIQTKKARTTADLLKYAAQYGAPEAEERLRVLEAENVPVDLAFDAISVHLRLRAYKRNSSLMAECGGKKTGLILPLPPHVPQLFLPVAQVTFLQPEDRALHGLLHDYSAQATKGTRACRAEAQKMEVLVFEAFRSGSDVFVEPAVADVLEPKMLPGGIRLIAHLRAHRNPGDVQFASGTEIAFI